MRPHEHYTDAELVRLLLTTEDEALREELCKEFVCRFQPMIARTVRRRIFGRLGSPALSLVDDLVQDTFVKICDKDFKRLRKFGFWHENALPGYLKVMADNVVRDYLRKPRVIEEDLDKFQPILPGPPMSDKIERRARIQQIEACLQRLAGKPNFPRDHKMFWLRNRDGLTAEEIFERPDMGFKTVKGVESALLRLNRWVLQCVHGGKGKKASSNSGSAS